MFIKNTFLNFNFNIMDKNSTIGIVLISSILFGYFAFFSPTEEPQKQQSKAPTEKVAEAAKTIDTVAQAKKAAVYGNLSTYLNGTEQESTLENENIKITFSNKGGFVKKAVLKNYKTAWGTPVELFDGSNNTLNIVVPTADKKLNLADMYFVQTPGTNTITFSIKDASGLSIEQIYALPAKGFTLEYSLKLNGVDTKQAVAFDWNEKFKNTESDIKVVRPSANINWYTTEDSYESLKEASMEQQDEKAEESIKWITFKSKFFSTGFISEQTPIKNASFSSVADEADSNTIKTFGSKFEVSAADLSAGKGNFKWYLGPNKYDEVKNVTDGFRHNVYLGWPVIRDVNRFIILPIFDFIAGFGLNFGLVILLLVIAVKTILLPLSYKAYMSMAKMRVLKPELDEIKARNPDDMQAQQQEQMKLYSSVGVNPLAGCVPVLLQMPLLLAMFNLFPNLIELRQQSFLWAPDLSTYDAFFKLPFTVPFLGSHVSLFTLLMTASTIFYTWYNSQMTTAMTGPMKTLQYIMPLTFMFILNSLPSGLTYYYFVSNMVTILQQFVIKQMVDEQQVRTKLDNFKLTPAANKKSRLQQRMEDAMNASKEAKKRK